eukprot:TRINITY_DN4303_c0_g2_i1.p1 TRINITY_DN4303_c0_g2~~TRINITY_DN4303_c0_g2_i1.p1  ORF type:complete len:1070 (-),score=423.26 TRINITY_DN4303_c0_g2_i1:21-3086(-)
MAPNQQQFGYVPQTNPYGMMPGMFPPNQMNQLGQSNPSVQQRTFQQQPLQPPNMMMGSQRRTDTEVQPTKNPLDSLFGRKIAPTPTAAPTPTSSYTPQSFTNNTSTFDQPLTPQSGSMLEPMTPTNSVKPPIKQTAPAEPPKKINWNDMSSIDSARSVLGGLDPVKPETPSQQEPKPSQNPPVMPANFQSMIMANMLNPNAGSSFGFAMPGSMSSGSISMPMPMMPGMMPTGSGIAMPGTIPTMMPGSTTSPNATITPSTLTFNPMQFPNMAFSIPTSAMPTSTAPSTIVPSTPSVPSTSEDDEWSSFESHDASSDADGFVGSSASPSSPKPQIERRPSLTIPTVPTASTSVAPTVPTTNSVPTSPTIVPTFPTGGFEFSAPTLEKTNSFSNFPAPTVPTNIPMNVPTVPMNPTVPTVVPTLQTQDSMSNLTQPAVLKPAVSTSNLQVENSTPNLQVENSTSNPVDKWAALRALDLGTDLGTESNSTFNLNSTSNLNLTFNLNEDAIEPAATPMPIQHSSSFNMNPETDFSTFNLNPAASTSMTSLTGVNLTTPFQNSANSEFSGFSMNPNFSTSMTSFQVENSTPVASFQVENSTSDDMDDFGGFESHQNADIPEFSTEFPSMSTLPTVPIPTGNIPTVPTVPGTVPMVFPGFSFPMGAIPNFNFTVPTAILTVPTSVESASVPTAPTTPRDSQVETPINMEDILTRLIETERFDEAQICSEHIATQVEIQQLRDDIEELKKENKNSAALEVRKKLEGLKLKLASDSTISRWNSPNSDSLPSNVLRQEVSSFGPEKLNIYDTTFGHDRLVEAAKDDILAGKQLLKRAQEFLNDLKNPKIEKSQVEIPKRRAKAILAADVRNWEISLDKCVDLLENSLKTVTSFVDSDNWDEVMNSPQWMTFLKGLRELFVVGSRLKICVNENGLSLGLGGSPMTTFFLADKIDSLWESIKEVLQKKEFNLESKELGLENPMEFPRCCLCKLHAPSEQSIIWDQRLFHSSCANFWANVVSPVPPKDGQNST